MTGILTPISVDNRNGGSIGQCGANVPIVARPAPRGLADSGAASGLVNVMQQVGGALGLSVLVTVFGTSTLNAAKHPVDGSPVAQAHHIMASGVGTACTVSVIRMVYVLVLVAVAVRTRPASATTAGR